MSTLGISLLCLVASGSLAGALWLFRSHRYERLIVCPVDQQPHSAILVGRPLELDKWDDVVACGECGAPAGELKPATCKKPCLNDSENSPRSFLAAQ